MKKRIVSTIMCLAMLLSLLPVSAFAAGSEDTPETVTLTFDAGTNGTIGESQTTTLNVLKGTGIAESDIAAISALMPTKAGFTFKGWTATEDSETIINDWTKESAGADKTYYAVWGEATAKTGFSCGFAWGCDDANKAINTALNAAGKGYSVSDCLDQVYWLLVNSDMSGTNAHYYYEIVLKGATSEQDTILQKGPIDGAAEEIGIQYFSFLKSDDNENDVTVKAGGRLEFALYTADSANTQDNPGAEKLVGEKQVVTIPDSTLAVTNVSANAELSQVTVKFNADLYGRYVVELSKGDEVVASAATECDRGDNDSGKISKEIGIPLALVSGKAITEGAYTVSLYQKSSGAETKVDDADPIATKTNALSVYKVVFMNGTTEIADSAKYALDGGKVDVPAVTPEADQALKGWKVGDSDAGVSEGEYTVDAAKATNNVITLTAEFARQITVSFSAGEGASLTQEPIKQAAGTTVNLTGITPTKASYVFQGWKLADAADSTASKTEFAIPADATAGITLVAVWKSDSIVRANLYTADDDPDSIVESVKVSFANGTPADGKTPVTITLEGAIPPVESDTTYYLGYVTELGTEATVSVTVKKAGDTVSAELSGNIELGDYVYGKAVSTADLIEANVARGDPVVNATVSGLDAGKQSELNTALTSGNTEIEIGDLVAAVAASETDMTKISGDDRYKAAVGEGKELKIEVYLDIAASNYVDNTLVLTITPAARVVNDSNPSDVIIDKIDLATNSVGENGTPVTISIALPSTLAASAATGNTFVKHNNEYLEGVTVTDSSPKKVTFTTSSFSPFEVVVDTRTINITFLDSEEGDSLGTVTLNLASVGKSMATLLAGINYTAPSGKTLSGWGKTADGDVVLSTSGTLTGETLDTLVGEGSALTLVPILKDASSETPGGGGGSSGGGTVSGNVTVSSVSNGKVTVTPTAPSKGATVTINLTPDTGYEVSSVTVKDADGNTVDVVKVNDTQYTFVMPDGKVSVDATFTQVQQPSDEPFVDISKSDYFYDAVLWAVEKGITTGDGVNTFGPNKSCTRAQMVTFLWRAAGSPAPTGSNSFNDVAAGEYYTDAVLWAVEKGITNGTGIGTFSPNATVTRGQTVTFLYRYAGSPSVNAGDAFNDVAATDYYANAVQWAVTNGITNGTGNGTFSPVNDCTRGQIVTFMYRQMAE